MHDALNSIRVSSFHEKILRDEFTLAFLAKVFFFFFCIIILIFFFGMSSIIIIPQQVPKLQEKKNKPPNAREQRDMMRGTDAIISHAQYPSNRFMSFYNCDLKKNKKNYKL